MNRVAANEAYAEYRTGRRLLLPLGLVTLAGLIVAVPVGRAVPIRRFKV